MSQKSILVSVIILAENSSESQLKQAIVNVFEQTHKNLDVIISCSDTTDIEKMSSSFGIDMNLRWFKFPRGFDIINKPIKECYGEFIFYKTIDPIFWYPRHIEHHLKLFSLDKKSKWSFSFLEYKNIQEQNQAFNALGWRLDKSPVVDKMIIDEFVHHSSIIPEWEKCITTVNNQTVFLPGLAINNQFKNYRVVIPEEITVIQWIDTQPQPQQKQIELGKPISDKIEEYIFDNNSQLEIRKGYPTVVGNNQWQQHNNTVKNMLDLVSPVNVKKIAIKRTMGMGDVLLVEPVIRALRKKYQNAIIDFYVGNIRSASDIVKYFDSKPDNIIPISEDFLIQDYLGTKNQYDFKFDFDLSYESRQNINYIDAYFKTANFKEEVYEDNGELKLMKYVAEEDKVPRLVFDTPRIISDKYVVAELGGSGWGGKEWTLNGWKTLFKKIKECGLKIAILSNQRILENEVNDDTIFYINKENDFHRLLLLIRNSEFYLGADNGPMHIASAFGKKCFVVAGAALPKYTSYSKNIYSVSKENLQCLHCKGSQFINDNGNGGITFVAKCTNSKQYICMLDLSEEEVLNHFNIFMGAFNV